QHKQRRKAGDLAKTTRRTRLGVGLHGLGTGALARGLALVLLQLLLQPLDLRARPGELARQLRRVQRRLQRKRKHGVRTVGSSASQFLSLSLSLSRSLSLFLSLSVSLPLSSLSLTHSLPSVWLLTSESPERNSSRSASNGTACDCVLLS